LVPWLFFLATKNPAFGREMFCLKSFFMRLTKHFRAACKKVVAKIKAEVNG
jgi:hypothetical protein